MESQCEKQWSRRDIVQGSSSCGPSPVLDVPSQVRPSPTTAVHSDLLRPSPSTFSAAFRPVVTAASRLSRVSAVPRSPAPAIAIILIRDALASAAFQEKLLPSSGPPLRFVLYPRHGGPGLCAVYGADAARRTDASSQMHRILAHGERCRKFARAFADSATRWTSYALAGQRTRVRAVCACLMLGPGQGCWVWLLGRRRGTVDAVEMFAPMADFVRQVVKDNGLKGTAANML